MTVEKTGVAMEPVISGKHRRRIYNNIYLKYVCNHHGACILQHLFNMFWANEKPFLSLGKQTRPYIKRKDKGIRV